MPSKFYEYYSNLQDRMGAAAVIKYNAEEGVEFDVFEENCRELEWEGIDGSYQRTVFENYVKKIFKTPEALMEYLRDALDNVKDEEKNLYKDFLNTVRQNLDRKKNEEEHKKLGAEEQKNELFDIIIREINRRNDNIHVDKDEEKEKDKDKENKPYKAKEAKKNGFNIIKVAFENIDQNENYKAAVEQIDQELMKDPYGDQFDDVPPEYRKVGKILVPPFRRPFEEKVEHPFKDDLDKLKIQIQSSNIKEEEKTELLEALTRANEICIETTQEVQGVLEPRNEHITGGHSKDKAVLRLGKQEGPTYKNGIYDPLFKNKLTGSFDGTQEDQIKYETLSTDIRNVKITYSKEFKKNLDELVKKMEVFFAEDFANPEKLNKLSPDGAATGFMAKIFDSRAKLNKVIKAETKDPVAKARAIKDCVKEYQELSRQYEELFAMGKELLKDTDPHMCMANADAFRRNKKPYEFLVGERATLHVKLHGIFAALLTAKKLGISFDELLNRPYGQLLNYRDEIIKSLMPEAKLNDPEFMDKYLVPKGSKTTSDGEALGEEMVQNGVLISKKVSPFAGRGVSQLPLLEKENLKENVLNMKAGVEFYSQGIVHPSNLAKKLGDVFLRPGINPTAYVNAIGAGILGEADKIRYGITELGNNHESDYYGFPKDPSKYFFLNEVKWDISKKHPKIDSKIKDLTFYLEKSRKTHASNEIVGFAAALYKILKNQDVSRGTGWNYYRLKCDLDKLAEQIAKNGVNPEMRGVLEEAIIDFKMKDELEKPDFDKNGKNITHGDVSDFKEILDGLNNGKHGSSPEFDNILAEAQEISNLEKSLVEKRNNITTKDITGYRKALSKTRKACETYLEKKRRDYYRKPSRSRSDYEKKRVVAITRMIKRLKAEERMSDKNLKLTLKSEHCKRVIAGKYNALQFSKDNKDYNHKMLGRKLERASYLTALYLFRETGDPNMDLEKKIYEVRHTEKFRKYVLNMTGKQFLENLNTGKLFTDVKELKMTAKKEPEKKAEIKDGIKEEIKAEIKGGMNKA